MNWLERAILTMFPSWGMKRAQARYIARQFTGADLDRLRARQSYSSIGPIQENRTSRKRLIDVARELDRNNSFAHGAFNALVNNIVGKGIKLESRIESSVGKLKFNANREAEEVWNEWAEGVDINRKMHFFELQHIVERESWVAGEILVVKVTPKNDKLRKIPLALEIVESERLAPIDSENPRIIQGVEFAADGFISAYHIYREHPSDAIGNEIERVPADRVLHIFHPTRPNQVRGLSRVAPVARNFEALNQFMEHELTKARIAACFAIMIKRGGMQYAPKFPSSGDTQATLDSNGLPVDANNNPLGHLEGGMIMTGGPTDGVEGAGPSIQSNGFAEFVATNLRAIATGLNMSYELLARDFTKTNFSSARQSGLEDKRHWEPRQQKLISGLCNPVYSWFKDAAILKGIKPFQVNQSKLKSEWITPPREYIDPSKEVDADIKAVGANFTTIQKICSKFGTDPHDNIRVNGQIAKEAEEEGITITSLQTKSMTDEEPDTTQTTDDNEGDKEDVQNRTVVAGRR